MDKEEKAHIDFLIDIALVGKIQGDTSMFSESYKRAINSAYRDLQRTISYKKLGKEDEEISTFKNECRKLIGNSLEELSNNKSLDRKSFDDWHRGLCISLTKLDIPLTIGQAQKWVNMALKYLYILEKFEYEDVSGFQDKTKFFHVPIDAYVISEVCNNKDNAKKIDIAREIREHSVSKNDAWSKWNDYDSYKRIQNQFREELEIPPFDWELAIWKRNDSCSDGENH